MRIISNNSLLRSCCDAGRGKLLVSNLDQSGFEGMGLHCGVTVTAVCCVTAWVVWLKKQPQRHTHGVQTGFCQFSHLLLFPVIAGLCWYLCLLNFCPEI